jgi:hypothetical protein
LKWKKIATENYRFLEEVYRKSEMSGGRVFIWQKLFCERTEDICGD